MEVSLLHPDARAPERTRPGDAGYDLRAVEPAVLAPGERAVVPTGVAVAVPEGAAGLVVALDERLVEVRRPEAIPLPDPTELPLANGDLRQAVIDELLGRDPPQTEPDATT